MNTSKTNGQYEVLSPWAEVDPIPLKGLTVPRVTDLAGKKIGLLCNSKRAALPIMNVIERELKKKFPTTDISWWRAQSHSVTQFEPQNKEKFGGWIKGVDAVILAVGD
jgi:hypothetical protein